MAAAQCFFHVRKQRFPHAYGGFEFSRVDAVINDVASPLASDRIWYSVYQTVARLVSLLEILETKGDPHAEGGSCDIMMALVEPFGPQTHLCSCVRFRRTNRRGGGVVIQVLHNHRRFPHDFTLVDDGGNDTSGIEL